jgi:2-iminobutanoate/2-iminopropanoate deaminase
MTVMKLHNSAKRYKAVGPYSQAVEVGGLIFVSGVIGASEDGILANSNLERQINEIFANIGDILTSINLTLDNVVKTTCFLTSMDDYQRFNDLYAKHFGSHRPARSTIQVSKLPKGALIEIEFILIRG